MNLLNLNCDGIEFASAMVIKASLAELRRIEILTTLRKDPPGRKPHLRTWRDGWRYLKIYAFLCTKIQPAISIYSIRGHFYNIILALPASAHSLYRHQ